MEGKREMEVAQTFIIKPDSVLEYSCFRTNLMDIVTWPPWSNAGGNTNIPTNMNMALTRMVRFSTVEFLGNFNYDHAGGRIQPACDAMEAVWRTLKCDNFNKADFRTFQDLVSTDPRTFPASCNVPTRSGTWSAAISAIVPPPALPASLGGVEQVTSYLGRLNPLRCNIITPIPTGVIVIDRTNQYPDAVCSAPGCYYNGSGACR